MSPPPPDVEVPDDTVDQERKGTLGHAVLVAVASLALAWSGFQGSEWARERLDASDESAALREEAGQLKAQAERVEQQDTVLYVQGLAAIEAGAEGTADKLFALFRPGLQDNVESAPVDEDGVPLTSPFESADYGPRATEEEADQVDAERRDVEEQAGEASANVARYGGMGVLFAVALVVTGIAGRFDDSHRRGLKHVARLLLVIGLVFLLFTPLSFTAP